MLTDYCQVNTSCWWSVVYPIKILDRLYFIVLIFKLRTKNTVSIHPKTKILFVLSCWYFCASLYCFLLALYLGDWSEAVNYGWISFAVWHFNQRDSSAAACVYVCVCLTLWVKHTHTHYSPPALLSPGGSKVVISLFQILIWQQLLPVARLPLGRQSPFKSSLPPCPPINTSPAHPPPPPSTAILHYPLLRRPSTPPEPPLLSL